MVRRPITCAIAAACLAASVAGCSGDRDTSAGRKISDIVQRFSLAGGPRACDLMTTKALEDNYGGTGRPAAKSRCVARSKTFRGQRVDITYVKITSSTGAHATARVHGAKKYFSVGLAKHGDGWLIDSVSPTSAK